MDAQIKMANFTFFHLKKTAIAIYYAYFLGKIRLNLSHFYSHPIYAKVSYSFLLVTFHDNFGAIACYYTKNNEIYGIFFLSEILVGVTRCYR